MQAKDIPENGILTLVASTHTNIGTSLWDVQAAMSDFPAKVVQAKLRSLVKRGILQGCACGCRGDFRTTEQETWMD